MTLAITIFFFVAVAVMIVAFGYRRYVVAGRTYETLDGSAQTSTAAANFSRFYSIRHAAELLGRKLPPSAETASALQMKLLAAGYRDESAVAILYGLKLMVVVTITTVMCIVELRSDASPVMRIFGIAVGLFAGFRLPDLFLARQVKHRRNKIHKALPDALDLIIVCAEAGLTIERSFRNVAQQLTFMHRDLSEEFSLFTAEISAGLRRKEALENLAVRTQESEIRKFVAVLTQADRFGTSMGDALRTHADYLRTRRRQEAEEKASKVSVKLIFPIFFLGIIYLTSQAQRTGSRRLPECPFFPGSGPPPSGNHLRLQPRSQIIAIKLQSVDCHVVFPYGGLISSGREVKYIIPFFFIMPCMMLMTVGPAAIVIMKELLPAMSGGH
jgi:tight adherence protein C